ncbi:MAG TPA: CoA transferase [Alphaproteobacteria bacterium]|nr:CoA transferase [Alphaproteobacteria bacterium]
MGFALLRGIRVLDLSQYIPGPYTTRLLADLGADVLKIEPPGGEPMRRIGVADRDGVAPEYKVINGGKSVLELDLKSLEGKKALEALLPAADILVESYRPGVLARLGFPPERLKLINPRLVHCALSGWGQTGPYRDKPGHDINYMALGGGLIASGATAAPVMGFPPVSDYASALHAALTIVAALFARERGEPRTHLDVSLMETVLAWQSISLTLAARAQPPQRGRALLNGGLASYNVYVTADGRFVSLGIVRERKFWSNFCEAVGRSDLIARFDEPLPQVDLIETVAALFAGAPLTHWQGVLASAETCFEPVADLRDVPQHPQVQARRLIQATEGTEPLIEVRYPAWLDGEPPQPRRAMRVITLDDLPEAWCDQSSLGVSRADSAARKPASG